MRLDLDTDAGFRQLGVDSFEKLGESPSLELRVRHFHIESEHDGAIGEEAPSWDEISQPAPVLRLA